MIGIQTLLQAVEMLHEDLAIANSSLVSERERAEQAERRAGRRPHRRDDQQQRGRGAARDCDRAARPPVVAPVVPVMAAAWARMSTAMTNAPGLRRLATAHAR